MDFPIMDFLNNFLSLDKLLALVSPCSKDLYSLIILGCCVKLEFIIHKK